MSSTWLRYAILVAVTSHSAGAAGRRGGLFAITGWLAERPLFVQLGLLALTVLFGLEVLRVLIPGLTWTLGDRAGLDAVQLGLVALLVFLTTFLAAGLRRLLGSRRLIVITAAGLGLLRLSMQLWWGEPLLNLGMAMLGTVFFVLFLPLCLEEARLRGGPAIGHFALGLLTGLVLDTALHGAFGTYDIIWQPGLWPLLLPLVLAQLLLLAGRAAATEPAGAGTVAGSRLKSLPWLAIGPFLFLQLVIFQNIARLTALTDWPLPIAFGGTLLAQLAGLAAAVWLLGKERGTLWPLALISGAVLITVSAVSYPQPAVVTVLGLLMGQVSLSLLLVVVLIGLGSRLGRAGFSGITVASGLGMVLLVVFLLGYYAGYQINLPFSSDLLVLIAASVVAVCSLVSSINLRQAVRVSRRAWLAPGLAASLLVLPLLAVLTWQQPAADAAGNTQVRIMTYNLHNGFNTDGYLDMEALARVIEDSNPDIIALQEVSRGWLVSGRLDMLTWLSQRLAMPYVSGPTADPLWGNAILSRYPIVEYTSYDLPPRQLPLLRGFTVALVDLGSGYSLQVIVTHYHHVGEDSDIRQLQSGAIVDFYGGARGTVLLGDFNAEPGTPEMEMLRRSGLVDIVAAVEPPPAYTFHSADLYQRIDYIWISPDLQAAEIYLPFSNASDHLAIVAAISR